MFVDYIVFLIKVKRLIFSRYIFVLIDSYKLRICIFKLVGYFCGILIKEYYIIIYF